MEPTTIYPITNFMGEFITIAKTSDLEPGYGKVANVMGKAIALFNVEGTFYALENTCLHRGGPIGKGTLEGDVVTCPWHQWQYNVKTGVMEFDSEKRLKTYAVKVEGEDVKIRMED